MTDVILSARQLTYQAQGRALVSDASLELKSGRLAIIVGPNGAGKSTLLKLLTGEWRPHAGAVELLGESLSAFRPWRLACIRAVLPQNSAVALPFTVREIASFGLEGVGRALSRSDKEAALEQALRTADVAHLAGRSIETLSGGERQRAHFARILCQLMAGRTMAERQLLFLDEPTANLDLRHQLDLLDAVSGLAADGVAVVAVVHDLNLAAAYADDLIVLDRGRIVANGAPGDVMTNALLSEVFRLDMRVGEAPAGGAPFILPQRRRPAAPG
jgi:iron complex transport system ATP-binding protein